MCANEWIRRFRREEKLKKITRPNALNEKEEKNGEEPPQNSMESMVPEVEKITTQVEAEVNPMDFDEITVKEEKSFMDNVDLKLYTPDPYAKEIIEKMAKQVKNEVSIVKLFRDGQVPEEIFTRLFNSMTDEINGLMSRREEVVNELNSLMKRYESTLSSSQQGIKLLDLQKSFGDVTDEEYVIKAAALNWDLIHYGQKKSEVQQKADYLRSLGNLIPVEEVDDLRKVAAGCMDASSMGHINDSLRQKIRKAMQEASTILNEMYKS